jgi:plasmid maintenance system antidote protein VapI
MEQNEINWLKDKIEKHHSGDRYEFAKAVKISRSAIEKFLSGQREFRAYHIDHFEKHFLCLENGINLAKEVVSDEDVCPDCGQKFCWC